MVENISLTFYFAFTSPCDNKFDFVRQDCVTGEITFVYTSRRTFKFEFFHDNILSPILSGGAFCHLHLIKSYYDGVKKEFYDDFARFIYVESLKHGVLDEDNGYTRDKVFCVVIEATR